MSSTSRSAFLLGADCHVCTRRSCICLHNCIQAGCSKWQDPYVLCCAVMCCAVLCCAVMCCAVLCCAVLCCAASSVHGNVLTTQQKLPKQRQCALTLWLSAKRPWQKEPVCQGCVLMQDALDPVWKLHEQKHLPLRTAAFVYALENVIKVAKARGYGG